MNGTGLVSKWLPRNHGCIRKTLPVTYMNLSPEWRIGFFFWRKNIIKQNRQEIKWNLSKEIETILYFEVLLYSVWFKFSAIDLYDF